MLIAGHTFERLQIGPITLHAFGFMVVVGFLLGAWLSGRLAREKGYPETVFFDASVAILLSGIVGARVLFIGLNWSEFSQRWTDMGALWQGGMSFHGGVAGGAIAGVWAVKRRGLPVAALADAAAPGLALGYAVGRLGCLMNGCCYGGPTDLPWGVMFREGDPGIHYHPVQVYATLLVGLLAALLVRYYRSPHAPGQVMAMFAAGYSLYRFGVEALRKGVTADVFTLGLTEAQAFSVLSFLVALAVWGILARRANRLQSPTSDPNAP